MSAGGTSQRDDLTGIAANDAWSKTGKPGRDAVAIGRRADPTGSRTQGTPERTAVAAASSMLLTNAASSVPILTTRACEIATNASTSSAACTIAGDAPIARSALAVMFITTKLVMLWTSGRRARDWPQRQPHQATMKQVTSLLRLPPPEMTRSGSMGSATRRLSLERHPRTHKT